jgi:hypothetical protein
MKKLLLIFTGIVLAISVHGQRTIRYDTLNASASDTTSYTMYDAAGNVLPGNIFFIGGPWSYHLDFSGFDDVDATITLYYSNWHPDSALWTLLHFDANADGTNDNPWTLSDTASGSFMKHGEFFPGLYFRRVLTRGSVSDSTACYEKIVKQ